MRAYCVDETVVIEVEEPEDDEIRFEIVIRKENPTVIEPMGMGPDIIRWAPRKYVLERSRFRPGRRHKTYPGSGKIRLPHQGYYQ